jgi:hypothetical protein
METKITEKGTAVAIEKLNALPDKLDAAIAKGLARGLDFAISKAKLDFLSGPRPDRIQSITGRLRMGVNASIEVMPNRIVGRVGDNVPYAAIHEFGFHGVVNVKAFTRVVGQVNGQGKQIDTRKRFNSRAGVFLGFGDSRRSSSKKMEAGFVQVESVRAHTRKVDYAGKPYIHPALMQSLQKIREAIREETNLVK